MKNLLGRLNARAKEDLVRIAAAWGIAVDGSDKLGVVAAVYRAMTDIRTIRDIWEALPEDERQLVALLDGAPDIALTIPRLAEQLATGPEEIRRRAASLYQKGLVVREGDDAELKVGELPKLFLPHELAFLFRRVQAEIAAGDVTNASLETLLVRLDDSEVEGAADAWGVQFIPGLKARADLIRLLGAQIADPLRRETVTAKLTGSPAKIWRRIRAEPNHRPIDLNEALAAAELSERDPRSRHRLRLALADLEDKLLVVHAYFPDGSRGLFVPLSIREPGQRPAGAPASIPGVVPIQISLTPPVWKHSHALAWDLLTLLRALTEPGAPRIVDIGDAPRGWLRRLNDALWHRGTEEPPEGYLAFLLDLASIEQLIEGGDAAAETPYGLGPEMRAWRSRSFADQSARLRAAWLSAAVWIEGAERGDVEVWGGDWAGFRLKLLSQLTAFGDREWRLWDDIALWLAARDPEMLGSTFRAATARATEIAGDERASRIATIAEVAGGTLETAFLWFGLIETVAAPRQPRAMRLTRLGAALAAGQPAPAGETAPVPAIEVLPSAEIRLMAPAPLRVWSLTAFADLLELAEVARYRLTERSIKRALAAGFDVRQISGFLAKETGTALPAQVEAALAGWGKNVRRLRVQRSLTVTPDDPSEVATLIAALEGLNLASRETGGQLIVEIAEQAEEDRAMEMLRANGYLLTGGGERKTTGKRPG